MKNLNLLPLDEGKTLRIKKFAELHQRFGKIIIDVIGFDKSSNIALIQVKDDLKQLTGKKLVEKVHTEVFKNEIPEQWKIFYTLMEENNSKFYKTWDNRFVIRPHPNQLVIWEVISNKNLVPRGKEISNADTVKAFKWFKNYLIMHNQK